MNKKKNEFEKAFCSMQKTAKSEGITKKDVKKEINKYRKGLRQNKYSKK